MLGKTHGAIGGMTGALLLPCLQLPRPQLNVPSWLNQIMGQATQTRVEDVCMIIIGIGLSTIGSLMPDLDEPNSTISREVAPIPLLSRRISMLAMAGCLWLSSIVGWLPFQLSLILSLWLGIAAIVKHRGITHSLLGTGLVFIAIRAMDPSLAIAFTVGYASHLLADMLTNHGVVLFWPFPVRVRIPTGLRTGSVLEPIIQLGATGITALMILSAAFGHNVLPIVQRWL